MGRPDQRMRRWQGLGHDLGARRRQFTSRRRRSCLTAPQVSTFQHSTPTGESTMPEKASSTAPRVYVGTYAKYNNGSIAGAWLDLEDYADKDSFLAACAELHKDEDDPEFMFQDFEG